MAVSIFVCLASPMLSLPDPQLLAGNARAFGHGFEFRPGNLRIADPWSEAAVGAGHDIFPANDPGITQQTFGDHFRVFDDVCRVSNNAGHDDFALRNLDVLP